MPGRGWPPIQGPTGPVGMECRFESSPCTHLLAARQTSSAFLGVAHRITIVYLPLAHHLPHTTNTAPVITQVYHRLNHLWHTPVVVSPCSIPLPTTLRVSNFSSLLMCSDKLHLHFDPNPDENVPIFLEWYPICWVDLSRRIS